MADTSLSDPLEPKELGTLIVVVGKARNLPNKSRFGKQDPFCSVRVGDDKKKTKAIKRGGQHPEWDQELRFTIMEDLEEVLARSESTNALNMSTSSVASGPSVPTKDPSQQGVTTAAALASKSRKGPLGKDKTGKKMIITCYADDAKEPDLIGECVVPIDEVLKKGEVDEWYEFLYKEKYSGEVYLELTFYSNDKPPVKRNPSIQKYGQSSALGAAHSSASLSSRPSISSLATSSSVAGMNLYIPPYIQAHRQSPQPPLAHHPQHQAGIQPSNSFANLGVPPAGQQQAYGAAHGPGQIPSAASSSTLHVHDPIDALTRPMSSMSISSLASSASRPLPPAMPPQPQQTQAPPQQSMAAQHRHSLGEAPWASLLPQNQPILPSHTPVSRPVSAAEAYGQSQSAWDHARLAASTPLARPSSGAGWAPPASAVSINGAYPQSLQAGQPPQPHHRHAHSFSGVSAGEPHPATYLKPATPQPPVPPSSAPPAPYLPPIPQQQQQQQQQDSWQSNSLTASQSQSHYPLPTSSFPTLTASSSMDPYRASTPTPSAQVQPHQQYPPQPPGGYQQNYGQDNGYDQRANTPLPPVPYQDQQGQYQNQEPYRATTPTPAHYQQQQQQQQNYYQQPPQQPQQQQQYPPAPQSSTIAPSSSSYYPPPVPTPPRRQSTPVTSHQTYQVTPPPVQPNAQGYVPWYQQIRPSASSFTGSAPTPPPPVPDYTRPAPAPPAPPKGGVGYYPSDELYVQQQQQQQQHQASPYGWQAPGQPPSLPSTASALETAIGQRAPLGWQSTVNGSTQPSSSLHDFQPYQAPYANTTSSTSSSALHSSISSHRMSLPGRTPSPLPPTPASETGGGQSQQQQHQPSAMKQDWKSYMASLGSSASYPARSASPLPPVPPQQQQQDWYTPPPNVPSSIRPQEGWNQGSGQGQGQGW